MGLSVGLICHCDSCLSTFHYAGWMLLSPISFYALIGFFNHFFSDSCYWALISFSNSEQESNAANQTNRKAHPARFNLVHLRGYANGVTKFIIHI